MRAYFDITDQDSAQRPASGSPASCCCSTSSFGEDLPLIFDFLGVPDPERPPPRMDPEARRGSCSP